MTLDLKGMIPATVLPMTEDAKVDDGIDAGAQLRKVDRLDECTGYERIIRVTHGGRKIGRAVGRRTDVVDSADAIKVCGVGGRVDDGEDQDGRGYDRRWNECPLHLSPPC